MDLENATRATPIGLSERDLISKGRGGFLPASERNASPHEHRGSRGYLD